jgi:hypothetical protein
VASRPYPWPYHGDVDPARTALVACLDNRWRVAGTVADDCDERLGRLWTAAAAAGVLLVAIDEAPSRGGLLLGAAETTSSPPPSPVGAPDAVISAGATNAFYASALDDVLRRAGRSDLLLAGWGLEGPVHSTLRAANDRGFECLLVPDASTPLEADLVVGSADMVCFSGGIFGAVAETVDVVESLAAVTDQRSTR